jgi:putative transposase
LREVLPSDTLPLVPSLRPKMQHLPPAWVRPDAVYFVTLCTRQRGNHLLIDEQLPAALLEAAAAYHGRRWWCHLWLIMPDHLHGLLGVASPEKLAETVGAWKRYTARRHGVSWQGNFFDHRLRSRAEVEAKAAYIRANPVRAGLIGESERWPWLWMPPRD